MEELQGFELTYLLGMAFQLLLGEFVRRLDELGYDEIRPVHGMAFQILRNGGATGTELAAELGITKQAVSEMVAHLEALGYVVRVPHPSGGRRQLIQLADRARAHLDVAGAALHKLEAEVTSQIGATSMRRLRVELAETIMALSGGDIPPLRPVW